MFQESFQRMSKDTTATAPSTMKVKVVAPPGGNNFCWRQTLPLRKSVADRSVRRPRWMVDGNASVEESPFAAQGTAPLRQFKSVLRVLLRL